MKMLIEIDDKDYANIMSDSERNLNHYERLIKKGVPLPKGHGRLIDAEHLKNVALLHNFHGNNKNIVPYSDRKGYRLRQREVDEAIINAPTIIEADKEIQNE